MRNIIRIAGDDIKKIKGSVVASVVILGLILIPSLYAWLNIYASWDPYGNTDGLKIAVANADRGYEGELSSLNINMGDRLITEVLKNSKFNWVLTDKKDAIDGVKSGKYYASVVVPADFSEKLMSLFTSNPDKPSIIYYSNEKENAIVSKITEKGAGAVEKMVERNFIKAISQLALGLAANVMGDDSDLTSAATGIVSSLKDVDQDLASLQSFTVAISSSMDTIQSLLSTVASTGAITEDVAVALSETTSQINLTELNKIIEELPDEQIKDALKELTQKIESTAADMDVMLEALHTAGGDVITASESVADDVAAAQKALVKTNRTLGDARDSISSLIGKIQAALDSDDIETLKTILLENPKEVSEFLSAPVVMIDNTVYPVENYGSAMAPFYTSLAIWVGGTILASLLLVELSSKRRKQYENLTSGQEYLGRYVLFLVIGLLQTMLIALGDLLFLGIQCKYPWHFLLACAVSSIVFVNIAYTLTSAFGNIGKAVCVIVMVIQVAGSGGTFPIELAPDIFRIIYPLLPFTHSMTAMRECIAGMYGNVYWQELGILLVFLGVSLAIGLVLRRPVVKVTEKLQEKLEETKVMG